MAVSAKREIYASSRRDHWLRAFQCPKSFLQPLGLVTAEQSLFLDEASHNVFETPMVPDSLATPLSSTTPQPVEAPIVRIKTEVCSRICY